MFWIFAIGVVTIAAALNAQVPQAGFSCEGRTSGYYADVSSGCQVYHMCDGLGRQFSYTCPNATLFQQRMLICDHWYMVNCSKSVDDYAANLRIGHRGMPFVDDSETNPYYRTPRPDLLSHPSESEYDIIYRTGRAQLGNNLNLVGVESDPKNGSSSTDQPVYSLPSHWSTEYNQQSTTDKPAAKEKIVNFNTKKNLDNTGNVKGKPVIPSSPATESPAVNYKSQYKNTTPVFPKTVESTSLVPDDLGVQAPLPYQLMDTSVPVPVNFQSHFQATTPVYPKTVDVTSEEPSDLGILPPLSPNGIHNSGAVSAKNDSVPSLSLDFALPVADTTFQVGNRNQEKAEAPSKFYQPPKFEPDYSELPKPTETSSENRVGGFKGLNNAEWENLRKKFFIPDYDFPLETISRPSYDSVLSSFQVDPVTLEKK